MLSPLDMLRSLYQRRSISYVAVRHVAFERRTGQRIVVVTDLHAREDWMPRPAVRRVVDLVNGIPDVDLVAHVGDFVGDDVEAITWAAEELGRITHPSFATLGNHDHWTDPERIARALTAAGVEVLTNRSLTCGGGLRLAGIDSCWEGHPDPDRALHRIPHDAPTVVLGHEPWLATMHDRWVHLAGHTHHGQCRSPVLGEVLARRTYPRYSQPYPRGCYEPAPGRFVYTSAGVGYSTVSVRFLAPPEVVVVDV